MSEIGKRRRALAAQPLWQMIFDNSSPAPGSAEFLSANQMEIPNSTGHKRRTSNNAMQCLEEDWWVIQGSNL